MRLNIFVNFDTTVATLHPNDINVALIPIFKEPTMVLIHSNVERSHNNISVRRPTSLEREVRGHLTAVLHAYSRVALAKDELHQTSIVYRNS